MALSTDTINKLAADLHTAEQTKVSIAPLTETNPDIDVSDAYGVQLEGVRLRTGGDSKQILGWKVGLTSAAVQKMLGVDEPDFGHLLTNMRVDEGTDIVASDMIAPRAEPEIAFQLKGDLKGPNVTAADVMAATEYLIPSLEIVDSRVRDWKIKLCDTISDNASCGRYVLGKGRTPPGDIDMTTIGMDFFVDGEKVGSADSSAVLGNPAEAVAWLVNVLAPYGHQLYAGQVIMPGSLVAMQDAKPGRVFRAEFQHIGTVETRFI